MGKSREDMTALEDSGRDPIAPEYLMRVVNDAGQQ